MRTVLLSVFACLFSAIFTGCAYKPLATVDHVDLGHYTGTWYEVARFDQWFERDCVNVTAQYAVRPDGRIDVLNSARLGFADGPVKQAKGEARIVDTQTNAKLRVWFFWPFEGDYWILRLAPDYSAAVVGSPNRQTLWFLSRQPTMDEGRYEEWRKSLAPDGFDMSRLIRTTQNAK